LAGSEGLRHSEAASREQRREGGYINRSLLALTQVIHALSEGGSRSQRANFRDSKLTRILRPSLGGNAQTVLVCALSPSAASRHETRSTLDFAARARRVENSVCVNIRHDLLPRADPQYQALRRELRELRSRVAELQGGGGLGGGGRLADLAQENHELRLKTEALQGLLLELSCEEALAAGASPCRRRRFSSPAFQDQAEVAFVAPFALIPEETTPVACRRAPGSAQSEASPGSSAWPSPSPTRLRQPGWRSRQPLRNEGTPLAAIAGSGPSGPSRVAARAKDAERLPAEAEDDALRARQEVPASAPGIRDTPSSACSAGASAEPGSSDTRSLRGAAAPGDPTRSAACPGPLGSWEFPLTKAEKHARLIHLFSQELSAVQNDLGASSCHSDVSSEDAREQEEGDTEADCASREETCTTSPAVIQQRLPQCKGDGSNGQTVRHFMKHEGCGLCTVQ